MLLSQVDEMEASMFPSVIGLHLSQLSLVLPRGSHAELQLSQNAFSASCVPRSITGRTAIFNKQRHLLFTQKFLYCIRSQNFLGEPITDHFGYNPSISI